MIQFPRPHIIWSYIHFVLEDLYFIAGIAGLIIVVINVINYYAKKKELLINDSDKEYELSIEFRKLLNNWLELQKKLKDDLEKTKLTLIQTSNYQDILKDKKEENKQYFIKRDDFISANIELDSITSFINEFENFSRKYLLHSKKNDFIDKNEYLKLYSSLYSFVEEEKHEQADKLFYKFSKVVTEEIKEIIPTD